MIAKFNVRENLCPHSKRINLLLLQPKVATDFSSFVNYFPIEWPALQVFDSAPLRSPIIVRGELYNNNYLSEGSIEYNSYMYRTPKSTRYFQIAIADNDGVKNQIVKFNFLERVKSRFQ